MRDLIKESRAQILPIVMGLFMAILFLYLTQVFCYFMARRNIDQYAQEILVLAQRISIQLKQSIDEAIASDIHDCSKSNITKMHMILWNKHFVNDIAVVKNNRIVCSAMWGEQFRKTQSLAQPGFIDQNGYKKIRNIGQYLPFHATGNLTTKQDIVAVTAPYAFESITSSAHKYTIHLTTPDSKYIFFETQHFSDRIWSYLPFQHLHTRSCLKDSFFCVSIESNNAGLARLPSFIVLSIAFMGWFVGVILTYLFRYAWGWQGALSNRLKRAIRKNKIYVEYQPIVEMKSQRISGVEALVRWKDKKYGQVSPELFIGIAEKANIDGEITKQVLNYALGDCLHYLRLDPHFSLSINLGKSDLTTEGFVDYAEQKIKAYDIRPNQIVFEITERVNIDIKDLEYKIQQIKNIGCRVSLDDFGTGNSNLSSLSGLSFNLIKIDRMFIRHFTSNQYWENILDAILSLAQENHHPIVFEGVETIEQFNYLLSKTSDGFIQGWLFYKAMSKHRLHEIIQKNHNFNYPISKFKN